MRPDWLTHHQHRPRRVSAWQGFLLDDDAFGPLKKTIHDMETRSPWLFGIYSSMRTRRTPTFQVSMARGVSYILTFL